MNRLATAYSPYLLQHRNNPVDWYPWGQEALKKARDENKIIILSIGYSACHWCHVMEHECFEDEEVAAYMNAHFVSIKVDREERPDIDAVYMDACQNMGIRGGWPLNVFLMPDQKPFYGGTYFPKPNWLNVLYSVQDSYIKQAEKLQESANGIQQALKQSEILKYNASVEKAKIEAKEWHSIIEKLSLQFDETHAGLQRSPKFPMPAIWRFLLQYLIVFPDKKYENHLRFTLERMVLGGIFDHLAGGWTRYATDERWKVPHFEKMLYDNGQLLSLYATFLMKFLKFETNNDSNNLLIWSIEQTISWLKAEMTHENGGFFAALDADSEGQEGKYYVWSKNEIENLEITFSKEFINEYRISEQGNWEEGHNILHLEKLPENFNSFIQIFDELKKVRELRVRPGLDFKQLCAWNALMLNGLIDAHKLFKANNLNSKVLIDIDTLIADNLLFFERYLEDEIEENFQENALGLFHQVQESANQDTILGFLDDYATLIKAYLNYYTISFEEKYLFKAEQLLKYTLANFFDPEEGLFFYTDTIAEPLIARKKEIFDNVVPSSNALMASNLLILSRYLSNKAYFNLSEQMYARIRELIVKDPVWLSCWADFALQFSTKATEVYIVGDKYKNVVSELRKHYFEPQVLIFATGRESNLEVFFGKTKAPNLTQIYVCQDSVCQLPVNSIEDALQILKVYGI